VQDYVALAEAEHVHHGRGQAVEVDAAVAVDERALPDTVNVMDGRVFSTVPTAPRQRPATNVYAGG
jgi:hypothetical protein